MIDENYIPDPTCSEKLSKTKTVVDSGSAEDTIHEVDSSAEDSNKINQASPLIYDDVHFKSLPSKF